MSAVIDAELSRQARVEQLRAKVQDGTYVVNPERVADRMVRDGLMRAIGFRNPREQRMVANMARARTYTDRVAGRFTAFHDDSQCPASS